MEVAIEVGPVRVYRVYLYCITPDPTVSITELAGTAFLRSV